MDKEAVAFVYSGILFSHKKKEILPFVIIEIDLQIVMLHEISHRTTNTAWSHLYTESKKKKATQLIDTENRLLAARVRRLGERKWVKVVKRYKRLVQFSLVAQCLTPWDPMNRSMPGLPDHHQFLEFTQTHAHWVTDAIQQSHPLSSVSPPAVNLSQPQGLFKWVSSLHQVAKVLEFQLQHQSFPWIFRTDFL